MPQYETNKHMKMAFTGEPVGIGDGEEDEFPLSVAPILAGSQTIYIDDVPQEETTDYTINATTGMVTFGTAPALDEVSTADYAAEVAAGETFDSDTIKNFRALRTAGKIRNVGQPARRAFTSGGRFRGANEPNA